MRSPLRLGIVVVTFDASDVILDCLESLLASTEVGLDIVVLDNASTDGTAMLIRDWAKGVIPWQPSSDLPMTLAPVPKPVPLLASADEAKGAVGHHLTLIEASENGGFARGVNLGLSHLLAHTDLDRFWVLNPDAVALADTARAFAAAPAPEGGFALMGGRVLYCDGTDNIQIDGGTVNRLTGVTGNLNLGKPHAHTPPPKAEEIDFIMGASMVASREFCETQGLMPEDYFLYYEEVEWALRRGDLPFVYCAEGIVYHRAGTAIGSATLARPASPFSLYFKYRARRMCMRRLFPARLPVAAAYALAKAGQLLLRGYPSEAGAILRATFGLRPPSQVRMRLSPQALRHIL